MKIDFIENLRRFNRKERFLLLDHILPNGIRSISEDFRREIVRQLEGCELGRLLFIATDYHLDWMYACLKESFGSNDAKMKQEEPIYQTEQGELLISATQQDIDLLLVLVV